MAGQGVAGHARRGAGRAPPPPGPSARRPGRDHAPRRVDIGVTTVPGRCSPSLAARGLRSVASGSGSPRSAGRATSTSAARQISPGARGRSRRSARHRPPSSAYARGARYFEAARSHGEAEAFLAAWLARRGLGPSEATVGSKWGYRYTANWRVDAPVHGSGIYRSPCSLASSSRAGSCWGRACASTRSTPRGLTAASSRTVRCSRSWPGWGRAGSRSGPRSRTEAAGDDRASARARRLRFGSGDVESARTCGRHHARRRSRGGSRRDRQAGARQRQFDRSR